MTVKVKVTGIGRGAPHLNTVGLQFSRRLTDEEMASFRDYAAHWSGGTTTDQNDNKIVFALLNGSTPNDAPTVLLIMPKGSWDYMEGGLGHEFDLTKLGVKLRLAVGRTETRETGLRTLAPFLADRTTMDASNVDMSFEKKT